MENDDDLAVRLWAVAAQLAALYTENDWCYRQSFPQTAEGAQLDLHAQMRGLTRRTGTCASGVLRMYLEYATTEDVVIEAGTVCTDAALRRFITLETVVLPKGDLYVDVPALATEPGAAGNAVAGTIVYMTRPPAAVLGVVNPEAFTGGADVEDDISLRARILDSYRRLPNGANAAWYEARVLEIEGVAAVTVIPRWQGIGTVAVVVADGDGMVDEALLAQVQAVLDAAREIATDVTVLAPERIPVAMTVQVKVKDGCDPAAVLLAVRTEIEQYFNGTLLGKPLYRAALGRMIYAVEGVENYELLAPAEDLEITARELPVLGTLSVTEMAAEV